MIHSFPCEFKVIDLPVEDCISLETTLERPLAKMAVFYVGLAKQLGQFKRLGHRLQLKGFAAREDLSWSNRS